MAKDDVGHPLSGASAGSIEPYQQALCELRCYVGDPVASVDRALAASPGFVMAHLLRAYLHLLGTEPAGIPVARASLAAADALPADARERGHREAVRALVAGRWHAAGRLLEDVAIEHPRDGLALQVGHQVDFFTGRSRMLRDRIARALPHWDARTPGFHALLGMHAFGLEECGDYPNAEARGRRAVELEPRDGWAWHAVAHVMEMQDRRADGIAWLRSDTEAWSRESFFCVHNWWHLALFHLDRGEIPEALALFDGPIHGARSSVVLDLIDASSLLWRLMLLGVDVGARWPTVAEAWAPLAGAGSYAFNDVHALMAFVGAGREDLAQEVFAAQARALERDDDNATFTREVGARLARALHAFGRGAYAETVELLRPLREIAQRFGGSHAQRDLLDRTLLEAARRSGQLALARALEAERAALRPASASRRPSVPIAPIAS
jgi:tetratricopeptide (TPR) repeat protein